MGKGRVSGFAAACICAALAFTVGNASASKGAWEEYDQLIRSSEAIAALGPTLFGDQSNLQNGGLSFSVTDVSLKGNNGLPVAITRTFKTKTAGGAMRGTLPSTNKKDAAMGDWDIDLPFVGGVFAQSTGWINSAYGKAAQRCSVANSSEAAPPNLTVGTSSFAGHNYWQGTRINIPGRGSQAMLVVNASSPRPTGSNAYWATSDFTSVACLPSIQNASGEGFIATTADGTRYWFDWMAMAYEQELTQQWQSGTGYDHLPRGAFGLYATRVEDRFGNWVTYSYVNAANAPVRLSTINASDGRLIGVNYNTAGFVTSVVSDGRTWSYGYSLGTSGALTSVVLPDSSSWSINLAGFQSLLIRYYQGAPGEPWRNCGNPGDVAPRTYVGTVTHPSGAVGEFTLDIQRFGRSGVTYAENCAIGNPNDVNDDTEWYPTAWDSYALKSKTVSGPGLSPATWNYTYINGTEVFGPGDYARYSYGSTFRQDEGKLLRVDRGSSAAQILNTTAYTYELAQSGMPYPTPIGVSPQIRSDDFGDEYLRPEKRRAITQEGATFNSTVGAGAFDGFARPLIVTKSSTLGYSKIDTTQYTNNLSKWVLGQVEKTTTDGIVTSETYYDPTTALPIWSKAFGRLQQTLGYYADGTLATVKDGRNNTTTLSNWKRGIPQTIGYAGGTTESAAVDDSGWITSVTDENGAGYTTNYTYDAMGRLASIAYPTGDSTVWATTTLSFLPIAADEYGLPAGHWKQTVSTGNARKNTYFDAMWRPVVVESFDAADSAATLSQVVKRYDAAGHLVYQSYPMRGLTGYTVPTQGSRTAYDALDRVTRVEQDSELGVLATTTVYQAGFQTQTTNPRLQSTTTSYRAYDQPSTDWPVTITHPEGAYTNIDRDVFGKPKSLTRRNADSTVALARYYKYDDLQQLCKTIEPETAATVMDYDAAGNVMWSASGLSYLSTAACDTLSVPTAVKVNRTYDSRNRVQSLSFPDSNGNQSWSYTPDGLPAQVTTLNDTTAGLTSAINAFAYNKRRLLTGESLEQPGLYTWSIGYGYNANGQLANHTSPGLTVDYAPNALGQPTQAGSYATAVSYFPNGAMAQFTYGNGIVHTLAQNARGLPDRSRDAFGATAVHDDSYDYDPNGNVLAISDGLLGNRGNRDMTYDGLDRLTGTVSPMFSPASYGYDVLDNLKTVKVAGRDHTYVYDPSWRLTNVTNTVGGMSVIGLGYDAQGNLANKNGQLYRFDYGNRLREATNKETYRYDGNSRRIQAAHQSLDTIYSLYGQDGVLRYQQDYRKQQVSSYVYLNGSLVARVATPASVTPAPTLSAPASSGNGAYAVTWSTVAGASRYRLEESVNSGAWAQVADTTGLSWSASGRPNGSYRYRSRSCHLGCSAYSSIATVAVDLVPTDTPTLTAPSYNIAGSYTVSWTSVSLATTYELHEQVNGGAWTLLQNVAAYSKAISGKSSGTYGYRVRGCNSAGCAPWSATASVAVELPPAAAPTLTVPAQGLNGAYTVTWGTAAGATSYTLEESANGGAWGATYSGAAQSQAFSGKAAGSYAYRIKACNPAGCSGVSATGTVSVIYPPATAPSPSAPSQGLNGAYTVSWTGVAGATSYQVDESANGGAWTLLYNAAGTSTALSGKAAGSYSYRAWACNAAGCGPTSGSVSVQVIYPPATAPSPSVPGQSSNGAYTVSWTAVGGATSYQMEESANGGAWTLLYNAAGISTALSGRAAGNYAYRARACNVAGCGPTSGSASVQVTYPPGSAPTVSAPGQNLTGAYTVSWTAVATATSYQLEESANGGAWTLQYNAAGTSSALSGKAAGSYGYRVRACNVGGCGPVSATATTQVVLAPTAAPTVTTPANVTTSSYTVSWSAVAAATSYQVWERVNGGAWTQIVDANLISQAMSGKVNASYGYQARGCNVAGCGPWSGIASTVVNVPPPIPAMPASLYGERVANEGGPPSFTFYVNWFASSGATNYELQDITSTPTIVDYGSDLSYQTTGTGRRTYQVRACNVSGCSAWQGPLVL